MAGHCRGSLWRRIKPVIKVASPLVWKWQSAVAGAESNWKRKRGDNCPRSQVRGRRHCVSVIRGFFFFRKAASMFGAGPAVGVPVASPFSLCCVGRGGV